MQEGEEIAAYVYDAAGRRTETRIAKQAENAIGAASAGEAALITTYAYDAAGNLTHQETSGDTALGLVYTYDLSGRITQETRTEQGGTTVSDYAYDPLGQLSTFTQSTGYAESYAYDKVGNMTQKAVADAGSETTLQMTYNKGNQLTKMQSGKNTISYSYDKNGSLVQKAYGKMTDTYAYDALGYLQSYAGYDGYTKEYQTNAQGLRMSKTETGEADDTRLTLEERLAQGLAPEAASAEEENATSTAKTTTAYIYDFAMPYGQVIAESVKSNHTTTATNYLYGVERIAGIEAQTQELTQYVYDVRGSVVQTLSTKPEAPKPQVQSYAYTPFGEQMGGTKVSGFGYNAEAYDAKTGMVNLRARQYEPAMNRFSQKDMLKGSVYNPLSLNRYAYVWNDPINLADPSGQVATGREATVIATAKKITANAIATNGKRSVVEAAYGYMNRNREFLSQSKELRDIFDQIDKLRNGIGKGNAGDDVNFGLMMYMCVKVQLIDEEPAGKQIIKSPEELKKQGLNPLNDLRGLEYVLEKAYTPDPYAKSTDKSSFCASTLSGTQNARGIDMVSGQWYSTERSVKDGWNNIYKNYEFFSRSPYKEDAYVLKSPNENDMINKDYEPKLLDVLYMWDVKDDGAKDAGHGMTVVGQENDGTPILAGSSKGRIGYTLSEFEGNYEYMEVIRLSSPNGSL